MAKKVQAVEVLEIEGVPTAAGLARQGLGHRRVDRNGRAYIQVTDEGHALLGKLLRERGLAKRRESEDG